MIRKLPLIVVTLLLLLLSSCATSYKNSVDNKETTIYLVRHAEKGDDGTRDPALTEAGIQRAAKLANLLKAKGVTQVYSTDYKRTRFTAAPTAKMVNTSVQIYDPRKPDEMATKALALDGQTILIVGHSNSTPDLTNRILGKQAYSQLSEDEYDKIFVIRIVDEEKHTEIITY